LAKRKLKKIYNYECTITGEKYKSYREAPHPDELISIEAYYELHPDEDDRPLKIKKQFELEKSE
jgi:hypothetical protein